MATRTPFELAAIAGVQQLPVCVLTVLSGVQEPSLVWCRSRMRNTLPRAPCHATHTRPFASVVATALTSLPAFSERLIGSDSLPIVSELRSLSQEQAQISKFARSFFGQLLFSAQKI